MEEKLKTFAERILRECDQEGFTVEEVQRLHRRTRRNRSLRTQFVLFVTLAVFHGVVAVILAIFLLEQLLS